MPVRKLNRKTCYATVYEICFNINVAYDFASGCGVREVVMGRKGCISSSCHVWKQENK